MTKLIFATLLIILGSDVGSTQTENSSVPMKRIDIHHPSVYITFEKWGGAVPMVKESAPNARRISLRLHNNTTTPIVVESNGSFKWNELPTIVLSDGGKVSAHPDGAHVELCYEAEAVPQLSLSDYKGILVPDQAKSYYSCRWRELRRGKGNTWIQPGHSIVFSVPARFLADNKLKIYTLFNYEWESSNGQMTADEPQHHVYYYAVDLPGRSALLP